MKMTTMRKYVHNYLISGKQIETPDGNGKVVALNILDISMQVKLEGHEQPLEYKLEEIETMH